MRADVPCVVRNAGQVVIRGDADLQSGPRGWRVTVYAAPVSDIEDLPEGRYELQLPSGTHAVRFDSSRLITREVRFVGIGDPPAEISRRRPGFGGGSNRPRRRA